MESIIQPPYVFITTAIIGLAIIILGFRFSHNTRKVVETIGAITFHVGVFGVLYQKVELTIFISLVLLVLSLFILIDPLRLRLYLNAKIYKLFGYIFLLSSVVFSLEYFTNFPAWLWIIPVVVYLCPYIIPSLRRKNGLILSLAWFIVIGYVGLIAYLLYGSYFQQLATGKPAPKYMPFQKQGPSEIEKQIDLKSNLATQEELPVRPSATPRVLDTPAPQSAPATKPTQRITKENDSTPFLEAFQKANVEYQVLQKKYETLNKDHKKALKENQELKEAIKKLKKPQAPSLK